MRAGLDCDSDVYFEAGEMLISLDDSATAATSPTETGHWKCIYWRLNYPCKAWPHHLKPKAIIQSVSGCWSYRTMNPQHLYRSRDTKRYSLNIYYKHAKHQSLCCALASLHFTSLPLMNNCPVCLCDNGAFMWIVQLRRAQFETANNCGPSIVRVMMGMEMKGIHVSNTILLN